MSWIEKPDSAVYPSKETMELFLYIWYKNNLFNTTNINIRGWNTQECYRHVNWIATLAVICEYLSKPWNEKEKKTFLDELEHSWEEFYKRMSELALDIIEKQWNLSDFSKIVIQSNRERLQKVESNLECFPTLSPACLPNRYSRVKSSRLIHKEFEAELARLANAEQK